MTDGWNDLEGKFIKKPVNPQVPDVRDTVQGGFRNCMLAAALSSCAWVNKTWIPNPTTSTYSIGFRDPTNKDVSVSISRNQFIANNVPVGTTSCNTGEIWPAMYEKAYAKFCEAFITRTLDPGNLAEPKVEPDFSNLKTGTEWGGNPITSMIYLKRASVPYFWQPTQVKRDGDKYTFYFRSGSDNCYDFIKSLCQEKGKSMYPIAAWTYKEKPLKGTFDGTISPDHSYSVLGWYEPTPDSKNIILRNPCGNLDPNSPFISQKPVKWTIPDYQYNAGSVIVNPLNPRALPSNATLSLGENGVFAVNPDTFHDCFEWFGLGY